jgi:hypothetical protein
MAGSGARYAGQLSGSGCSSKGRQNVVRIVASRNHAPAGGVAAYHLPSTSCTFTAPTGPVPNAPRHGCAQEVASLPVRQQRVPNAMPAPSAPSNLSTERVSKQGQVRGKRGGWRGSAGRPPVVGRTEKPKNNTFIRNAMRRRRTNSSICRDRRITRF